MHNAQFLIVDDSRVVRTKVRTVLENEIGATNIFEASDGTEAMKILQLNKINMIISDWNMPNLSGVMSCIFCKKGGTSQGQLR